MNPKVEKLDLSQNKTGKLITKTRTRGSLCFLWKTQLASGLKGNQETKPFGYPLLDVREPDDVNLGFIRRSEAWGGFLSWLELGPQQKTRCFDWLVENKGDPQKSNKSKKGS